MGALVVETLGLLVGLLLTPLAACGRWTPPDAEVGKTSRFACAEPARLPLMDIRRVHPDDAAALDAVVALAGAARVVDAPWEHALTRRQLRALLTHGWDGEPSAFYAGWESGRLVVVGELLLPTRDNRDSAWQKVVVSPRQRGLGYGARMQEHVEALSAAAGRTVLGAEGPDTPVSRAFAARSGYEVKYVSVYRRVTLAEVPAEQVDAAYVRARAVAEDYELVRLAGPLTDEQIAESLPVVASINDAPTEHLLIEDEVYTAERVRAYEESCRAQGLRMYRVWARRRDTGEVAGHTVVGVQSERPHVGEQHDTTVLPEHRGHRLGLLLKADMMRWLRNAEPALETITTDNAESNRHMIEVNERLGYRVVGRGLSFQRLLTPATSRM